MLRFQKREVPETRNWIVEGERSNRGEPACAVPDAIVHAMELLQLGR
jgi:hypothetical protein